MSCMLTHVRVFVSWSGRQGKALALALRTWLPSVVSKTEVWVSTEDIAKGERALPKLLDQLQEQEFAIVITTKSSQASTWVAFECGALANSIGVGRVAPVTLGISEADVEGPLSLFQSTNAGDKMDLIRLINSINKCKPDPEPEAHVVELFENHWPELRKVIVSVRSEIEGARAAASNREVLEEILRLVRLSSKASSVEEEHAKNVLSMLQARFRAPFLGHQVGRDDQDKLAITVFLASQPTAGQIAACQLVASAQRVKIAFRSLDGEFEAAVLSPQYFESEVE